MWFRSLFLVTIVVQAVFAAKVAELKLKFKTFTNPEGTKFNGDCCDEEEGYCVENGCDHYFKICVDTVDSPKRLHGCTFYSKTSDHIENHNAIIFNNRISNLENPMVIPVYNAVPKKMRIRIEVWDYDKDARDEYVDNIEETFSPVVLPGRASVHVLMGRTRIMLTSQLVCAADHYGPRCTTICKTNDRIKACNKYGKPICNDGWKGSDCSEEIAKCPDHWTEKEVMKTCYLFDAIQFKTWPSAMEYCENRGGELLGISSYVEREYISDKMTSQRWKEMWTGLNDRKNHGWWQWTDNSRPKDEDKKWVGGTEPAKGGSRHCASIGSTGSWTAQLCESRLNFICEKPMWTVDETF